MLVSMLAGLFNQFELVVHFRRSHSTFCLGFASGTCRCCVLERAEYEHLDRLQERGGFRLKCVKKGA